MANSSPSNTPTGLPPEPSHYTILSLPQDLLLSSSDPGSLVRKAYRRALLLYHPDKNVPSQTKAFASTLSSPSSPSFTSSSAVAAASSSTRSQPRESTTGGGTTTTTTTYTIDQITTAYTILSSPSSRQKYNKSLLLCRRQNHEEGEEQLLHATGIETVDLDDLTCHHLNDNDDDNGSGSPGGSGGLWTHSCRCGNETGFEVSEADLEESSSTSASDTLATRHQKLGELLVGCKDCSLWLRVHFAVVEEDEEDGYSGESDKGVRQADGLTIYP